MFKEKLIAILQSKWLLLAALIVIPVILGIQSYISSINYHGDGCPHYSTYQVFKHAHFHLLSDQDLYSYHESEHCFTYKYSPAFALVFGAFARMPDALALVLWMLLSGIVSYFTIQALPNSDGNKRLLFFLVILFEWMVSVQGQQTNVLVVMFLLMAFVLLERNRPLLATLLIVITGFIKIFGFGAMLIFLLYPRKWKFALYSLGWGGFLALLPLLVLSPQQLSGIYHDWFAQITSDYGQYNGLSVYSFTESVFGLVPQKQIVLLSSLFLLVSPLLQIGKWRLLWFRQSILASILIWVVVFNHKAESHSYIIAMTGIALWFFAQKRGRADIALLLFAIAVISIMFSDLVPRWVKSDIGFVYSLKAFPSLVVWLRIQLDLWMTSSDEPVVMETKPAQ